MELSLSQWSLSKESSNNEQIVLLHGLAGLGKVWRPIAAELETQFDVIAPDQRGHGKSLAAEGSSYEPIEFGKDLAETFVKNGIESAWVVGHSMGVRSACALAHLYPQKVKGLVLVDLNLAPGTNENKTPLSDFLKEVPQSFESREEMRAYLKEKAPDPSFGPFLLALARQVERRWSFSFDRNALLKIIKASEGFSVMEWIREAEKNGIPALILRGAKTKMWKKEDFDSQKQGLSSKEIVFEEFENSGHGLPFEERKRFCQRLKSWIQEVRPQ